MGGTSTLIIGAVALLAIESLAPRPIKPTTKVAEALANLEATEIEEKAPALVAFEDELARVQRENEIELERMKAEFHTIVQTEVARVQAQENAKAQIAIANIQAANERANKRIEAATQNQLMIARTLSEQADRTSGVKSFAANIADIGCGAFMFAGDPNHELCGAGDKLRAEMARDVVKSIEAFTLPPETYLGSIVDPAQLELGRELQNEYGMINTIGAENGNLNGTELLGALIDPRTKKDLAGSLLSGIAKELGSKPSNRPNPTPSSVGTVKEPSVNLSSAEKLTKLKKWEQDLTPLAVDDPFIQEKVARIRAEIDSLQ